MTDPSTDEYTLLGLLADIRAAAGDREGRLMQPELVEHIRKLKARADEAEQLVELYRVQGVEQDARAWLAMRAECEARADELDRHRAENDAMQSDAHQLRQVLIDVRDWDVAGALDPDRPSLFALPHPIRARIAGMIDAARAAREGAKS